VKKTILIVDDEKGVCDIMAAFLSRTYNVLTTVNPHEALSLCDENPVDMVISDIQMGTVNGLELLSAVRTKYPHIITMLMTGYDTNDYIDHARRHGISNIIAKTAPFSFPELEALVDSLLHGAIFGLPRYLINGGTILARHAVRSSAEAVQVRTAVTGMLAARFGSSGDMNLVLDEILTNALYHAPVNADGTPKYRRFTDVQLDEKEFVTVECGFDTEKYGVSVTDNSGSLTRDTVLQKLLRQVTGEGILDDHGRGLHMSRLFSDRMIINIKPNERTEVIFMNYISPKYQGYKPIYINEI